jgi:hypothetical protein
MRSLQCVVTSGFDYPATQRYITEEFIPRLHRCDPSKCIHVFFVFNSSSFLTSSFVCFTLKISQFRPISADHYVLYSSFHNIPHQSSYFHSTLIILCSLNLHPFIPHHNVRRIIFFPLQLCFLLHFSFLNFLLSSASCVFVLLCHFQRHFVLVIQFSSALHCKSLNTNSRSQLSV